VAPVGFPASSQGVGRFGGAPNSLAPAGKNTVTSRDAEGVRWYESGPFYVIVFLTLGYILVFQTLRR
jgi:hypothetical protein